MRRDETKAQTDRFGGAVFKSFTAKEGGRKRAEKHFEEGIQAIKISENKPIQYKEDEHITQALITIPKDILGDVSTRPRFKQEGYQDTGQNFWRAPSNSKLNLPPKGQNDTIVGQDKELNPSPRRKAQHPISVLEAEQVEPAIVRRKKKERPESWEVDREKSKKVKSIEPVIDRKNQLEGLRSDNTRKNDRGNNESHVDYSLPEDRQVVKRDPDLDTDSDTSKETCKLLVAGAIPRETTRLRPRSVDPSLESDDYEDNDAVQAMLEADNETPNSTPQQSFENSADYIPFTKFDDEEDSQPAEPKLCKEQADLCDLIMSGANVFYTGSAGCGKSTVLKVFVARLQRSGKNVAIVSPTGLSAVNVGGTTLWSWMGWIPDDMKLSIDKLANKGWRQLVNRRLCSTDVLVIDEVSMIENLVFERLDICLRVARNNKTYFGDRAEENSRTPFGGTQIVVTGDFCQLQPVKPFENCRDCDSELTLDEQRQSYSCLTCHDGPYLKRDKWANRSNAWKECNFKAVHLEQIHRQTDRGFIEILQKCRISLDSLTEKEVHLLLNHECDTRDSTKLFPRKMEVDRVNKREFDKLAGPTLSFVCHDSCRLDENDNLPRDHWKRTADGSLECLKEHRLEQQLNMKRGMLVILTTNLEISEKLINGTQGIICDFMPHDPTKLPEQFGENKGFKRHQIEKFIEKAEIKKWPLVEFRHGSKTFTRLIKPYCTVNQVGKYSWVSRTQVPLVAGWALTIHKSQGMSLQRVEVHLATCWEAAQVYVALSRATTLSGLKVHTLWNRNLKGSPEVMEFLRNTFPGNSIDNVKTEDEV